MNLYDRLAEPVAVISEGDADTVRLGRRPAGPPRPTRPGTVVTETIETTDERMINLRHTIASP